MLMNSMDFSGYTSFSLLCVGEPRCKVNWSESFCSGFRLKFSRIALLWKRLQLDSKTDLTRIGLFLEFFVGICLVSLSSSNLHGLKI